MPKTTPWDSAEYLKSERDIAVYLEACVEEAGDDPAFLAHALGVVARARNMSQIARDTGMTREGLYKALSAGGNPSFATVLKVANALGLRISFKKYRFRSPRTALFLRFPSTLRLDFHLPHHDLSTSARQIELV